MKIINIKKSLSCIMAMLLLLTSLSVYFVSAENQGNFTYEVLEEYNENMEFIGKYAVIKKYTGSDSVVNIPSAVGGIPVKVIEYAAFQGNGAVTSITVSEGVEAIGDDAFKNCVNLTQLNLPDTLKNIGCNTLLNTPICKNSSFWEDDLLYIGNYLIDFDDTSDKTDVVIKEGTKLIAGMAFGSADIESVNFPKSLKYIDAMAFDFCENLTEINLPENLETIGTGAFENCTKITEIYVPDSVTKIDFGAFSNCTNLKTLRLSNNLTEIPFALISQCKNLKSLTIPASVKFIDYFAFEYSGLESVTIPAGVEFVGGGAFIECGNLTAINVESANPYYYSDDGVLFMSDEYAKTLHTYPANKQGSSYTIPADIRYIDDSAFDNVKNLKTVVLNDIVSDVNFKYAYSIENVIAPESQQYLYDNDGVVYNLSDTLMYYPCGKKDRSYTTVEYTDKIKESSISDNKYLKELTITEGVKEMEIFAVNGCNALEVINLPSTLSVADSAAIHSCNNLQTINFNGTKAMWTSLNIQVYTNSTKGLYLNCTDGTFELVAPYEEETDFTYTTEPTEPTEPQTTLPVESTTVVTDFTEPSYTNPAESSATEPTEITTTVTEPDSPAYSLGDVNMDNKLNIRDATAIQKYLAKLLSLDETALKLADFTQDSKVNIKDATQIQKKIAGLI